MACDKYPSATPGAVRPQAACRGPGRIEADLREPGRRAERAADGRRPPEPDPGNAGARERAATPGEVNK